MKSASGSQEKKITRAGFVRGVSLDVPVAEVIEMGKAVGLQIKPGDVHAARHYMKQRSGSRPRKAAKHSTSSLRLRESESIVTRVLRDGNGQKHTVQPGAPIRPLTVRQQFRVFALRLGLNEIEKMVDEIRAEFEA